jgi:hypothetical protein
VTRQEGVVAENARRTGEEIDAFLSVPDGMLLRTLRGFPAANVDLATRATRRTRDHAERLTQSAQISVEAAPRVAALRQQWGAMKSHYSHCLPTAWCASGGEGLGSRIDSLHSVSAVERFEQTLKELDASLTRQQTRLTLTVRTLREHIAKAGVDAPAATGTEDLEGASVALAAAIRNAALRHTDASVESVTSAADAQIAHLGTTRGTEFVRPPVSRSLVPKRPVLRRWSELHVVRRRPKGKRK